MVLVEVLVLWAGTTICVLSGIALKSLLGEKQTTAPNKKYGSCGGSCSVGWNNDLRSVGDRTEVSSWRETNDSTIREIWFLWRFLFCGLEQRFAFCRGSH